MSRIISRIETDGTGGTTSAHASTHQKGGTDEVTLEISQLVDFPSTMTPSAHTHAKADLTDATATPTAGKIPIADGSGKLDGWVSTGVTLGTSVTGETSFGIASSAGTSSTASKSDHTHGTPANPVTAHESTYDHSEITNFENIRGDTYFVTGFVSSTDTTISLSTRDVSVAKTGTNFSFYAGGIKYTKTTTQTTTIAATVGLHYIYFDSSGTLQNTMSAWEIYSANCPVCIVYWNGSVGVVFDERHLAGRNLNWHKWAHTTIGTRYITGLEGTFTSAATTITAGSIADEDLLCSIAEQTSVRVWYRSGSSMTFDAAGSATSAKIVTGALQYDSAGSLTPVSTSKYVTNWVYATLETALPIMVVVGQAEYNTVALARAASQPTFPNTPTAELKLLYRVIWQNSGGTPTYVESADYRASSTLPAGGVPVVAASGVTFTASGNVAATNVQTAIEELDTEKAASAHAPSHIRGASDEIDGDKLDIDWNPTNYTPTTVTEADNADHLSAHLKGIDAALGSVTATYSITITAGEALSQYDVVYLHTDAKCYKAANNSTKAVAEVYAIVTQSGGISSSGTGTALRQGDVTNASWSFASAGLTVYLSTAGAITATEPTTPGVYWAPCGETTGATSIYFAPSTGVLIGYSPMSTALTSVTIPITMTFDNGSSAISAGAIAAAYIPQACTIQEWTIGSVDNTSGSIVIDLWVASYASFPPTVSNTITASAKPTVSSATKAQSSTLTGWTTSIPAGSWVFGKVDSCTSIKKAVLALKVVITA